MTKKAVKRTKHIPQRTCAGCRKVLSKRELIRIVRTPNGICIDPSGKMSGRGVYLHNQRSCWEQGLKGAIKTALKVEMSEQDLLSLKSFMANLPDEHPDTSALGPKEPGYEG